MNLHTHTKARLQATVGVAVTLALWAWTRSIAAAVLMGMASTLALLAWIAPRTHTPVQRVLDALAHAIAVAISWVVLALVYGAVFVPIRAVRFLAQRDPLGRRSPALEGSYLRPLPKPRSDRFERMY